MGNKVNRRHIKKKKICDRQRSVAKIMREAKANEREHFKRELKERKLAASQDGAQEQNNLQGTSESPQVEIPKNKPKKSESKPVEILKCPKKRHKSADGLQLDGAESADSLSTDGAQNYPEKRRKSADGLQLDGAESVGSLSTDGAQGEGFDYEDDLLLAKGSEPPQPVTEEVGQLPVNTPKRGRPRKSQRYARPDGDEEGEEQPRKIKKGRQYNGREIIAKVYHFLQKEYEFVKQINGPDCDLRPLANVLHRTALATGVTDNTVRVILDEERRLQEMLEEMREAYVESQRQQELHCGQDKDSEDPLLDNNQETSLPDPDPEVTEDPETINIVKVEYVDEESEMINAVASITAGDQAYQRVTDINAAVDRITVYQDEVTELNSAVNSITEGDQGYKITEMNGNVLFLKVSPLTLGIPGLVPTVSAIPTKVKTECLNGPESTPGVNMATVDNLPHMDPLMTSVGVLDAVKTEPPDETSAAMATGSAGMPLGATSVAVSEIGSTLYVTYTED